MRATDAAQPASLNRMDGGANQARRCMARGSGGFNIGLTSFYAPLIRLASGGGLSLTADEGLRRRPGVLRQREVQS